MASLTALAPACVASAVQRCYGHEHAAAVARPASGFFLGECRLSGVARGLRSSSRIGSVAFPRVSATYEPLVANPPFSKPSGGSDNSALKAELLVRFATSSLNLLRLRHVVADGYCF
jgi:hypothetical protein